MATESRLRAARKARKITLAALAEAVGVDHTHLSRVERGGLCSAPLAAKLATYFGRDTLHEMELLYPDCDVKVPNPSPSAFPDPGANPPARIRVWGHVYRLEVA